MTIPNTLLQNMAKALNSESFSVPTHNVVSTEVQTLDLNSTTLSGIVGTADDLTNIRAGNTVTFTTIRSGTSVVDTTNGDFLKTIGVFDSASGGDLLAGVSINDLHTTAFDLEFKWNFTIGL